MEMLKCFQLILVQEQNKLKYQTLATWEYLSQPLMEGREGYLLSRQQNVREIVLDVLT